VIFNVMISGIGSFEGPIIGTIVYFVFRQYLGELSIRSRCRHVRTMASCRADRIFVAPAKAGAQGGF
jgi:ABC-type branched-subunit amino acid transport system permease subunit